MASPIRFVFGVHLHQPVGNFDSVLEQHLEDVYRPLLLKLDERGFLPAVIHLSGALLEWLEGHATEYLDQVGRLASDGRLEILLAGMYEPVLASLPREDRVEQIGWLREWVERRFGCKPEGLWLTERVWEPEVAADLADAGVQYVLVDDRHFLVTGFRRSDLHRPYVTESDGKRVRLFPIDERLRYLVPFRPPAESGQYLRELAGAGQPLVVFADDGEKFGGWPGTKDWVYTQGWLDQFLTTITALMDNGEVLLSTLSDAYRAVAPAGVAYLPTASYREMESWALPAPAAQRLHRLERDLGETRMNGPDGALIRGAHWRNFFVKYAESNRMHKKMMALSALCRQSGDPPSARREIGRAQCNDAYWHGVFGGLYLPHLRNSVWYHLALAEQELRRGTPLECERVDLDFDGHEEIWIHGATLSAIVSPARGGVFEELSVFADRINYANVLTRRRESYHPPAAGDPHGGPPEGGGTTQVQDMESAMRANELPPHDLESRVLLRERVLPPEVSYEMYARGDYDPVWSVSEQPVEVGAEAGEREVVLTAEARRAEKTLCRKRYTLRQDGTLLAEYQWDPGAFPDDALFAPEISYGGPLEITCTPAAELWSYDIETMSKSERGLEATVQGRSVTPRWPIAQGGAAIELVPRGR